MKIAVFGATGAVGREVVAEARLRGHEVTTLSTREGAADVVLDLGDTPAVAALARTVDAVVVSVPPSRSGGPHDEWITANANIAATDLGARVLLVGGAGSTLADGKPLLESPDFPAEYLAEAKSAAQVLEILRRPETKSDWTIISPAPVLTPGSRTGTYHSSADDVVGERMTTQDLAVAILDELEEPRHRRTRFTVAS